MTFPKSNNNLSLLLKEFDTTSKYFDIIKNGNRNDLYRLCFSITH